MTCTLEELDKHEVVIGSHISTVLFYRLTSKYKLCFKSCNDVNNFKVEAPDTHVARSVMNVGER